MLNWYKINDFYLSLQANNTIKQWKITRIKTLTFLRMLLGS